jgi:hypothetical protein
VRLVLRARLLSLEPIFFSYVGQHICYRRCRRRASPERLGLEPYAPDSGEDKFSGVRILGIAD